MAVITEPLADVAGSKATDPVIFWTEELRENEAGTGTTITRRHQFLPVNGVLTTTDLDAGPAKVKVAGVVYSIVIPETDSTIRLWPLLDAAVPNAGAGDPSFVRNANNIRRVADVTQSDYAALSPDPDTVYFVFED